MELHDKYERGVTRTNWDSVEECLLKSFTSLHNVIIAKHNIFF